VLIVLLKPMKIGCVGQPEARTAGMLCLPHLTILIESGGQTRKKYHALIYNGYDLLI
jgi:hypothetical protein